MSAEAYFIISADHPSSLVMSPAIDEMQAIRDYSLRRHRYLIDFTFIAQHARGCQAEPH